MPSLKQISDNKLFSLRMLPLIFFIVTGAITFLIGISELVKGKDSLNWPSVKGKVISSSVRTHYSSSRGNPHAITYYADITYMFTVKGKVFYGDRISFRESGYSNSSSAQSIIENQYPKGKIISVRYMPESPDECLIYPGIRKRSWIVTGAGLLFLFVGILALIFKPNS